MFSKSTKCFDNCTLTMVRELSSAILIYGISPSSTHDELIDFFFDTFKDMGILDVKPPQGLQRGCCCRARKSGSVLIVFETPQKAKEFVQSRRLPLKMTQLRRKAVK